MSQVASGAFLYQIDVYDRTPENEEILKKKLGFLPETHSSHHLLPGVSPGKNTPIILDYVRDREKIVPDTLYLSLNMT
jgi:hypothetical protein